MSNEEKIKEILEKIKSHYVIIDTEGTGDTGAEKALQEYGQWVRQQTLEEAIEILERHYPDIKGIVDEVVIVAIYKELQALKERK